MKLSELEAFPDGALDCPAHELHEYFDGPTLVHLPGERSPPLFVSVLLHGNEEGGWEALRLLLGRLGVEAGRRLPRALSILVGNVEAARFRLRRLDHQPDFNRIWKDATGPEAEVARAVVASMARRGCFMTVDAHNNTGVNPHYACITRTDPVSLALARRFSRTVVHVLRPDTILAAALAPLAPAIILEAGRPGEQLGVDHVADYLEGLLELEALPTEPEGDIDLFHTVASVRVREAIQFGFTAPRGARDARALHLLTEFEHFNFQELPAGTLFGHVAPDAPFPFDVTDDFDRDVGADYFVVEGQDLRLAKDVVPAMFTPDARIIRQDVLCYLMERVATD
ncbi:MAG: hypothetical protein V2I63_06510 [Pseudomonadales bacterium]|nr:hypothetical protein [Pseudomonadales bacterium]